MSPECTIDKVKGICPSKMFSAASYIGDDILSN